MCLCCALRGRVDYGLCRAHRLCEELEDDHEYHVEESLQPDPIQYVQYPEEEDDQTALIAQLLIKLFLCLCLLLRLLSLDHPR